MYFYTGNMECPCDWHVLLANFKYGIHKTKTIKEVTFLHNL